jgi:hypothetical protein
MFWTARPFYETDLVKRMPGLLEINEKCIAITQPNLYPEVVLSGEDEFSGSMKIWVWVCATYLIERDIIVYNGLPSTEVSGTNLKVPADIKTYSIFDLGFAQKQ